MNNKTLIFYFSGTGNSLHAAKQLSRSLPESEVVPMVPWNCKAEAIPSFRRIALVYPVHMNAVPRAVEEFLERHTFPRDAYLCVLATHGGIPGLAGQHLLCILKKCSISLDAYFEIKMINNTPKGVAPKALMSLNWERGITPEITRPTLDAAAREIGGAAERIGKFEMVPPRKLSLSKKYFMFPLMKTLWDQTRRKPPELYFILDDCCTGCGTCARVCTSGRISMEKGRPVWEGAACNYCYGCFNYCPAQAVGVKHYTKKLGRYHHPEVPPEEIAAQKNESAGPA